jgi:hypothetical protein
MYSASMRHGTFRTLGSNLELVEFMVKLDTVKRTVSYIEKR